MPGRDRERISRSFAVAAEEVTVPQFQRFLQANPTVNHSHTSTFTPDPDGAVIDVTWFEAAQYCNWLSQNEGLPQTEWCYLPNAQGMTLAADYLRRTGYRLPTEAEWEYACRAGAATSRFYGTTRELLGRYARYSANSDDHAWRGGTLKPNDFGLFDMYGNVLEWCHDSRSNASERGSHGEPHEDCWAG